MRDEATVQLLPTCLVGELKPETAEASVRLLEALGLRVEVPLDVVCCGQPALNSGFRDEARAVARHAARVLAATEGPIVIPSGSCADTIVHRWRELAEGDDAFGADVDAVAERCSELSAFIAQRGGPAGPVPGTGRAAYHPSCHLLRGLKGDGPPRALLEAIDGLEVVPLADEESCCGFGGMFAVDRPAVSAALLAAKLDAIGASGADVVTACDQGCLLHLEGGLRRRGSSVRVRHIAELLDGGVPE
ncbi:MAG: (Fe-S)-binding protein [Proteobacteria bacterium]|nr:(Fe-S)-binding protein [Pseudomonadota bacterium]